MHSIHQVENCRTLLDASSRYVLTVTQCRRGANPPPLRLQAPSLACLSRCYFIIYTGIPHLTPSAASYVSEDIDVLNIIFLYFNGTQIN